MFTSNDQSLTHILSEILGLIKSFAGSIGTPKREKLLFSTDSSDANF